MAEKVRLSSPALRHSPTAQQDRPRGMAGRPSLWRPIEPLTAGFEVPSGRLCPMWMGGAPAQLPHPTRQSAKAALQLTALGSCCCPQHARPVPRWRPSFGLADQGEALARAGRWPPGRGRQTCGMATTPRAQRNGRHNHLIRW